MRVPRHVVEARRERLAQLVGQHRYLPVKELCKKLEVSEATLRRDLGALAQEKKITRTYGGALHEFNDRFPSFRERQGQAAKGKAKIATRALDFIRAGGTYFLDSGTTIFSLAEAFRAHPVTPVTIVTSNLPVGEMLASIPGVRVFQTAGELLHLQSTLLGETAQRSIEQWGFDVAFLSAEGMDSRGIWNSQPTIVEQQKIVMQRAKRHVFCIDASKLSRQPPYFLAGWPEVDVLLTDASDERLAKAGVPAPSRSQQAQGERSASAPVPIENSGTNRGEPPSAGEMPVHIL